jgi:hypothetical protein
VCRYPRRRERKLRLSVWPVGCGLLAMVVADSAFVLAGLALSRASPLPQGLW